MDYLIYARRFGDVGEECDYVYSNYTVLTEHDGEGIDGLIERWFELSAFDKALWEIKKYNGRYVVRAIGRINWYSIMVVQLPHCLTNRHVLDSLNKNEKKR